MDDDQVGRRRHALTPLEIMTAVALFGVIVAMGVLMMGHPT